ncbi:MULTISPECIES: hypothetical protein [Xanthomonas]|nr:hypothetical protein [Xanthomonas euvesicatoria]WOP50395.1 hypothetical protein R2B60_22200 [Xanthomonas euvesicatoria]WOP54568.1 hypothetical protein R5576_22080 [Xanthomonas euvesicatoria]WOP58934.1 hypothetical protein R5577_21840 [Xanthomonas euvesicatoria]
MYPIIVSAGVVAVASDSDSELEPGSIADDPAFNDPFRTEPDREL